MENDQNAPASVDENAAGQTSPATTYSPAPTGSTYVNTDKKDKRGFLLVLITISVLIIIGGVVFFFSQREIANEETESVLPAQEELMIEEPEMPSATEKPVDVSLLKVKIMNGTGIAREAAYVEGLLTPLGFKEIEKTNAATTDYVNTEVAFSAEVEAETKTAVVSALEKAYKKVVTKTLSSGNYQIEITTGQRIGAVASPTPKPTASTSATASPKASASAVPSPTGSL